MARKEITRYYDDLTGEPIDEQDLQVLRFALDETHYQLDLSPASAQEVRNTFARLIEVASIYVPQQQRQNKRRSAPSQADRELNKARRQWARDNGWDVADRGKLSDELLRAFDEAHPHLANNR
ncbi:Lsr2 family protein [Corynebacterium choanae]|uniref:Nucleoid-associated protein Lsr2 n=1 Tax=Corynebacterium choanae TaxID=1862358 RepID=A0A3G6J3J7_9CORY|nr:Lsr2 family protein [Corynebacterium choanae]AZA12512.1 Nucleoid-associated protein Lsr2 [Corynebacterium choanae]